MIIYFREGEFIRCDDLIRKLNLGAEEGKRFVGNLLKNSVLRLRKRRGDDINDLDDDSDEIFSDTEISNQAEYAFIYVGVIKKADKVIICYPKYMENEPTSGLALYLLQDYFDNGLYSNEKEIIETNGNGQILWNKIITHALPFIKDSKPYYFELKTKKRTGDENNFFRKLHQCILTECSKEILGELSVLFQIPKIELTMEKLSDFGDKDKLIYMINKELNVQFYTRKIRLLKAMAMYISQDDHKDKNDDFYAYGTKCFYRVWEDVCKNILGDQLNTPLNKILLTVPEDFEENATLMDLIDKPKWADNQDASFESKETLEPDIIRIRETSDEICFDIFDAKYYMITTNGNNIMGNPRVQDITKQYLYQLAYQKLIKKLDKKIKITNRFVLPKETSIEKVELNFFSEIKLENDDKLEEISIMTIAPEKAYDCYLKNERWKENRA